MTTSFTPHVNAASNAFGRVCLSVCVCLYVCPVCALTFESIDREASFLMHRYILRISRSNLHI